MDPIIQKALNQEFLTRDEALELYLKTDLSDLIWLGNEIRKQKVPGREVGWIIDRNVNISNVCVSRCSFCNFHRRAGSGEDFVTGMDEYREKIEELYELGGNQLLLQGGLNPSLRLNYYTELFSGLKAEYPELKLHALGPPEIHFLAGLEKLSYRQVLEELIQAGLDSLPGAGAEILCDEIRKKIAGGKANSQEWLDVMRVAHRLNLPTSATMMYGHIESYSQRIEHMIKIRDLQQEKPEGHHGFITFVPWPFQAFNTRLKKRFPGEYRIYAGEYIRIIAIARIILTNIDHIQASWLTVGLDTAAVCLHAGADDLGSIMIEENVVSSAGANFRANAEEIQDVIKKAGFAPRLRNQKYETI